MVLQYLFAMFCLDLSLCGHCTCPCGDPKDHVVFAKYGEYICFEAIIQVLKGGPERCQHRPLPCLQLHDDILLHLLLQELKMGVSCDALQNGYGEAPNCEFRELGYLQVLAWMECSTSVKEKTFRQSYMNVYISKMSLSQTDAAEDCMNHVLGCHLSRSTVGHR